MARAGLGKAFRKGILIFKLAGMSPTENAARGAGGTREAAWAARMPLPALRQRAGLCRDPCEDALLRRLVLLQR